MKRLTVSNIAQIKHADMHFGDLTVLVGPQATGKSIFLQLLKLIIDYRSIILTLRDSNVDWGNNFPGFLDVYFGEGMSGIFSSDTRITSDGKWIQELDKLIKRKIHKHNEEVFYIPAQRVLALRDGMTRPFSDFRSGDPFVLRDFSDKLHRFIQNDFSKEPRLFPHPKRLKGMLKNKLEQHIFGKMKLESVSKQYEKRLMLVDGGSKNSSGLPYLVWSAGQREFVPMLMGLYWLIPAGGATKRSDMNWVVVEEPEMGLHADAIAVASLLLLELLGRGYKVVVSTHSPQLLDVIWAMEKIRRSPRKIELFFELFDLGSPGGQIQALAEAAVRKKYKVYNFRRNGEVQDISNLDPCSENGGEADWGGLTEFSGRAADIVGGVV